MVDIHGYDREAENALERILIHEDISEENKEAQSLADKYQRNQEVTISPLVMSKHQFQRELKSEAPLEIRINEEGEPTLGEIPDG